MNQHIERLLESAPFTTISTEGRLFSQKDMAVFAEALVRACAEWIKNTDSDPDIGEADAQALREHFGVEL